MSAINPLTTTLLFPVPRMEEDYETLLTQWERDVSIGGDKSTAAQKIREAIRNRSDYLNLSDLALTQMPPLGGLSALRELNVSENRLSSLPEEIRSLTALELLDVSNNGLRHLPEEIRSLRTLQALNVSNNRFTNLPIQIFSLTALEELMLESCHLTSVPIQIVSLTMLKRLYLTDNKLMNLPVQIFSLTALEELGVSDNKLTHLPEEIRSLTALKELRVAYNNLSNLPREIEFLRELEVLNVCNNNLMHLPEEIRSLTLLKELNLSENTFTNLPIQIFSFTALEELTLDDCGLTTIPIQIASLTMLKKLHLSGNELTHLPIQIFSLTALEILLISENKLTNLPAEIEFLRALEVLHIDQNPEIEELPLTLGSISGLIELNIEGTKISPDLAEDILRRCQVLREERAFLELPERLRSWHIASHLEGEPVDISHFTQDEQVIVNEWLVRLERTRDFRGNQRTLASTVCHMLATTKTHPEFKRSFLTQIEVNNTACEDRAAMAINELYTAWKVSLLPEGASLQEKLDILVQGSKTLALRAALAHQIRDQGESVEIYLFYETHLASSLNLLSLIQQSAYATDIGKRKWINEAELVRTVEQTYIDQLVQLPMLQTFAEQDPTFKAEWTAKELEFSKQLEQLDFSTQKEQEVRSEMDRVTHEKTQAQKALLKKWFIQTCNRKRAAEETEGHQEKYKKR